MADRLVKALRSLDGLPPSELLAVIARARELGGISSSTERSRRRRDRLLSEALHATATSNGHGNVPETVAPLLTPPSVQPKKVLSPKDQEIRDNANKVLAFLNEKRVGKRGFEAVEANLKHIVARLKEGATVEDCKSLIAKKWREWGDNTEMQKYVRPKTLFCPENFAQYIGELGS